MKKPVGNTLIHETNEGQHRLVMLKPDGTNDTGEWVEQRQVAHLNETHFAICGESPLPQGVFTVRVIPFQQLG